MHNYYFTDENTGEDFIVEAATFVEAYDIATDNFLMPKFNGTISSYEAEWLGIDTY